MVDAAKKLAIWLGVAVLVALLGSCGLGFAVSRGGESAILSGVRDVSVILLLILYVVQALIWTGVYFALAWVVGYFGPRLPAGVGWAGAKLAKVEAATESGAERFAVRPLARAVRYLTTARAFVANLAGGVSGGAGAVRRWSRDVTDWSTLRHRQQGAVQSAVERRPAVATAPVPAAPVVPVPVAPAPVASAPMAMHADGAKGGSIVESGEAERR
jgi:hypothetical protein